MKSPIPGGLEPATPELGWTLRDWSAAYETGALAPGALRDWTRRWSAGDPAWIETVGETELNRQLEELETRDRASNGDRSRLPLYGIPFAIKDNIDAKGWVTTAACPAFAYSAGTDAEVVRLLRDAGAILIGKTNLDQFATGLVGTRSPYGAVPSAFDPKYIGGGSSSGSASVVARGWVPFALGTDTAGSGRVPAAFQNVVGWKPTRGRLSTRGVVPACRTLDCVSVFALTVADAEAVVRVVDRYDAGDPYARRVPRAELGVPTMPRRLGIPNVLEFFGDDLAREAFEASLEVLPGLGCTLQPLDFAPFHELAKLLYAGPWVWERRITARRLLATEPAALDPVVRGILSDVTRFDAEDVFSFEYRRAQLAAQIDALLGTVDALLVPTTPTTFRIDQVAEDPVGTNSRLGTYTNFTNLADLSAIALPGKFRGDGLPAGLTLLGRAHAESTIALLAKRYQGALGLPLGATGRAYVGSVEEPVLFDDSLPRDSLPRPDSLTVAVVGAHMRGMALNAELTSRGAEFVAEAHTAAHYRLFALPGASGPERPALLRVAAYGAAILLELWSVPLVEVGSFLASIPPPLGIGSLELDDGRWVKGFIVEPWGLVGASDITAYGGFRAYLKQKS